MKDPLKKLQEQQQNYEEAFGNAFKRKPKQFGNFIQEKNDGSGYLLNGNPVFQFVSDGTLYPFSDAMWTEKENLWVVNGKFDAITIHIKNKQISMNGQWFEGEFNGYDFFGNQSVFKGGTFHGQRFSAPNKSYLAGADNYYSGAFINNENGILGYDDLTQEIDNSESDVELVTIPVGWYVSITDENGKKIKFQIAKRIDEIDTNFQFLVLPKRNAVDVPWEVIRSDYLNKGFIVKGRPFSLLKVEGFGNVISFDVKQTLPSNVDFSAHDKLKKFLQIARTNFTFDVKPSSEASAKFTEQFLEEIPKSNGRFFNTLEDLKVKVGNGQVTGHAGFPYLFPVFNKMPGEKITDKETLAELQYLNDVVKYIGGDSIRIHANGKEGNIQKNLVNSIKKYLGVAKALKNPAEPQPEKQSVERQSGEQQPGVGKTSQEKRAEFIQQGHSQLE